MGVIPGDVVLNHRIQDGQELAHAGDESNLLRFPGGKQPLIEPSDHGVVACADESGHKESSPHRRTAAPHPPLSAHRAAVTVEGRPQVRPSYMD